MDVQSIWRAQKTNKSVPKDTLKRGIHQSELTVQHM